MTGEEEGKGREPPRKTRRETFTAEHVANNINCLQGCQLDPWSCLECGNQKTLVTLKRAHACGLVIEC